MKQLFTEIKHKGCRLLSGVGLAVALAVGHISPTLALTAGESYTVVVSQINSDGSLTSLSSTSATADSNGKIAFSLSSLPDADQTNFVLLEVKDSSGNVVRQGIAPAPGPDETNDVGVNPLSDVQAEALRATMTGNNTDNPLAAAFGLVFIRSQNLESADISGLGTMMATAILGNDGMEAFLLANGISQGALDTFKSSIVYNPGTGTKDLSDYVAFFKQAVDNGDDDDLARAGGLMADILIDAGATAGIDPQLLLAAFNAAGNANGLDAAMLSLSSGFQNSVNTAVSGFFTRIASVVLKKDYNTALATLGGSQTLIDRFNTAVQTFVTAQQAVDTQYGQYFMDPQGYLAANPGVTEQDVQAALDAAFQAAWNSFQTAIVSTGDEITAMRTVVASAMGTVASDPVILGIGTEMDFDGNIANWPIPQTVAVTWVANTLIAGGNFSYTRDTTAVPANMQSWLDSDDDGNNGVDGQRHDFTSQMPAAFAALMGIMEDVQIVEETRYAIWGTGSEPTPEQQEQARIDFASNLGRLAALIGGTTDGSTAIGADQKKALIKLMVQPSLN
ncbi:MAG: hypothetical protein ACE5FQ_04520 [Thiogranum sp.]